MFRWTRQIKVFADFFAQPIGYIVLKEDQIIFQLQNETTTQV